MSEKSTISKMLENHNSDTISRDSNQSITNHSSHNTASTSARSDDSSMKERVIVELESCYHEAPQYVQDTLSLDKIHVSITGSFKRVHGKCAYNKTSNQSRKKGHYHIQIAKNCISNNANWRDTVRHEFAHAIAYEKHGESQGHNENWKQICKDIGAKPTRCANTKHTQEPYQYACPNECWISGKHKRSKKIQKPWQKHCAHCNENCVSFDTGDPVPDTPGTCAVESIPWNNRYEYDDNKSMN